MDDRKYLKNCIIAFIIGLILIGSGGFKDQLQSGHYWVLLFVGYVGVSLYVGWRILRSLFIDSLKTGNIIGCLVIPVLIPICIIGSFLIGMFASIPMVLRSILRIRR
ncbi:hypothetical protein M5X11_20130 [Paenibacillus alginolyticus]|uniref:Uncharacterized protein n=1 Tax=Paenibacillus alginolyticus TaxID=59839 RepID=A0ABT4G8I7_9BACL|nr:hypothetical protein [Paenibacillus alginolyticus]MCY9667214.1 hypothetical protein [Paenibacillus alginolyticus]MCY9692496.1 hypothetical protein [Paenibacillus alginolyticus]MEC0144289.1 hypothetical protein [Paenibacillus alginolyticus]